MRPGWEEISGFVKIRQYFREQRKADQRGPQLYGPMSTPLLLTVLFSENGTWAYPPWLPALGN
jgi:hypothetical protein